jgi:diguanylate cyclase (GGDEF)-like protein
MLLLQKTILSPLLRLTSHVLSVRTHTDFSMRLALERRDEIGTLAREFDRMLEKIEQQTMALEVVNEQLRDDITKRQQAEKALQKANHELQRLVTLDGLTQIPNRRRFEEHINQEWKRARRDKKPISLIMCDVDYFKLYNDTYGHQLGDDCLRAIAKTICQNVKRPSDLAARYGGEEFVVILPETDSNGAVHVAQRIRFQVEQLQMEHKNSLAHQYVTLSLGISTLIPSPNLPRERLIALADKALYEAKKQGRNRAILEANPKKPGEN